MTCRVGVEIGQPLELLFAQFAFKLPLLAVYRHVALQSFQIPKRLFTESADTGLHALVLVLNQFFLRSEPLFTVLTLDNLASHLSHVSFHHCFLLEAEVADTADKRHAWSCLLRELALSGFFRISVGSTKI